jgi:uncharacterized protein YdaU (DUF1376 family)
MLTVVNYYSHHIGDYAKDTGHLSLLEHGAYRRLLDCVYASERPLPRDRQAIYRLIRARSQTERVAVDAVLEEFWIENDEGWHNKRAGEEIAKVRKGEQENSERKAHQADRQRRHRERRAQLFEQLRAFGEIPKWDTSTDELEKLLASCHRDDMVLSPQGDDPVTPTNDGDSGVTGPTLSPSEDGAVTHLSRLSISHKPKANSQKPSSASDSVESFAETASDSVESSAEKNLRAGNKTAVAAWEGYAKAFEQRYSVPPVRNAKINRHFADLVKRIPAADAPAVAAFFLRHNLATYVRAQHAVGLLLRDCEGLHAQWRRGSVVTDAEAKLTDRSSAHAAMAEGIIREMNKGSE